MCLEWNECRKTTVGGGEEGGEVTGLGGGNML